MTYIIKSKDQYQADVSLNTATGGTIDLAPIYHNMDDDELDAAVDSWSLRARTPSDLTAEDFCYYVNEKNSMTGSMAFLSVEELDDAMENAIDFNGE